MELTESVKFSHIVPICVKVFYLFLFIYFCNKSKGNVGVGFLGEEKAHVCRLSGLRKTDCLDNSHLTIQLKLALRLEQFRES